ncbi:MAG: caspase family protein [Cyanobacteriota bacterium]
MNKIYITVILLLLNLFIIMPVSLSQETHAKYALIIGIDYKDSGYDLQGGVSGAVLIEDFLNTRFKFNKMITLYENDATRSKIIKALEELGKIVKPEDEVFIYFAGHGRQINDDDKDEIDNLDEVIVPYDFKNNEANNYISDDDVAWLLEKINTKNLTMIFDSCHSGTANRVADELDAFIAKRKVTRELPEIRGVNYKKIRTKNLSSDKTSSEYDFDQRYIFIAAAMENEKAFDGSTDSSLNVRGNFHRCGSFTSALYRVLNSSKSPEKWSEIIKQVRCLTMLDNPFQIPVLYGNLNSSFLNKKTKGEVLNNKQVISEIMPNNSATINNFESSVEDNGSIYISESGALLKINCVDNTENTALASIIYGKPEVNEMVIKNYQYLQPVLPPVYILSKDEDITGYLSGYLKNISLIDTNSDEKYYSNVVNVREISDKYKVYLKFKPVSSRISASFMTRKGVLNWVQEQMTNIYNFLNIINISNFNSDITFKTTLNTNDEGVYSSSDEIILNLNCDRAVYINVFKLSESFKTELIIKDKQLSANNSTDIIIKEKSSNQNVSNEKVILKIIASINPLNLDEKILPENIITSLKQGKEIDSLISSNKYLVPVNNWTDDLIVYRIINKKL